MEKLTKSLLLFKERNCTVAMVLNIRTNRKKITELPLAIRFTVNRKSYYHAASGVYSEKRFSDICNATKCTSENYKLKKSWMETYGNKYATMLMNLNKGGILTYEMVHSVVVSGNTQTSTISSQTSSFLEIWETIIHELKTDNGGARYTTSESYECALNSFKKIMGIDSIKGFNISAAEIQKWKDGMHNGVVGPNGKIIGKISDTTAGIYLRSCRAVWNRCIHEGYLKDVPYPFSNKREKGLVSIPHSARRRQQFLNVQQMTQLYNLFMSKKYPIYWDDEYKERAHYSLGLFLVQYLCNGFNMADEARLTYDSYYYQSGGKAFRFNRKKTAGRSLDGAEVIIPIIKPLQNILDEIAAPPSRDGYVFPNILNSTESEKERRIRTQQENQNVKERIRKICTEVLHWDESIQPSGTWARHSFATNLRNAGVEMDYISESMGHSTTDHAITQIYIEHYPLETQIRYNEMLLDFKPASSNRERLLGKLEHLNDKQIAKLFAMLDQ